MSIYLSVLIALVGLVVYVVSSNGKVAELGRIAFFAGLLAFLFGAAGHVFTFPR